MDFSSFGSLFGSSDPSAAVQDPTTTGTSTAGSSGTLTGFLGSLTQDAGSLANVYKTITGSGTTPAGKPVTAAVAVPATSSPLSKYLPFIIGGGALLVVVFFFLKRK
jgi:hypothetical protein